jgi:L-fucose isomerase-like protein
MKNARVGCYAVYEPPEEGWGNWESQLQQINTELAALGIEIVKAPKAVKDLQSMERVATFFETQRIDMLHALIVTWSFDHYTIEIQQRIGVPIAIRAIPGIRTGSVVGTQQLGSVLKDIEVPYRLFYGEIGDLAIAQAVVHYAKACGIYNSLRGARMAVIGRRTEGMTPTAVDEVEILRHFGIRLINYGLDELDDLASAIDPQEAVAAWNGIKGKAREVLSKPEDGIRAARYYLACKQLVAAQALDALTIGSYPKCQGTMCIPIAWLNEEGLPTGCEGDVNSTINMFILSQLSSEPVHFGEMLAFDPDENTLVTSHCGCGSPSLASSDGFTLSPVRLANDGVCIRYTAKPGPVTFVNLVGRRNTYRMCAVEGEAVSTGLVFEGNPLKFVLKGSFSDMWSYVDQYGFGHHWMTVYTHCTPVLLELCKLVGMQGVFPDLKMTLN